MRILTEQELRRAVDGTVRRTLAENSQDEGIGKWLLGGAGALLGLRYWPQIKNFFSGLLGGDDSSQTPPQGPSTPPSTPPSGSGNGYTNTTYPPMSGSSSDGQLEDWQKEWRRGKGQDWGQDPSSKPNFNDAPPQARTSGQTRPSGEISALDKVDAMLSNPSVLRQLSRDEVRLLLMYRMMLSNDNRRSNNSYHSNNTNSGYARGHKSRSSKTTGRRGTGSTPNGNNGYAPGHRVR